MSAERDVLIVGGGVIGLTTAYFLARDGARVSVIDKGDFGREASWAGAGIIPPGDPDKATNPIDRLRAVSARMYGPLSEELRERTGIDNGYRVCGGVELASGTDAAMLQSWRAESIRFETVPAKELTRIEAAFSPELEDGYYLPDMAQVRNPWHLRALVAACRALGVELLPHRPALRLLPTREGAIRAVDTPDGPIAAPRFLLAAGAWTDRLLEPLGRQARIVPVRGQIVLFRPDRPIFGTILVQGKHYLVPRGDGRILAGSTEEDSGFVKLNTDAAVAKLAALARKFVPALEHVSVETTWSGLRPGSADGLPTLGRHPDFENLFLAAGHFRAGIQLSPATGRVMAELLQNRPTTIPLDGFRLDRPPGPLQPMAFHT